MSTETATKTQDTNALCQVLAYATADGCIGSPLCYEGNPCIPCLATRLLEENTPSMSVQEAVEIIKHDLLGEELQHWRDNGCPRNSHYVALAKLIQTAESLPF